MKLERRCSIKKIEVDFKQEVPFHVDGEFYHASEFMVEIFPEKLPVIYNPDGPHFFKI
jgi:diacylglycerol kinase family enzyme